MSNKKNASHTVLPAQSQGVWGSVKAYLRLYFVDAMSAMAQGLFASLLVGTIISTLGTQLGVPVLTEVGSFAKSMSGPAMAVAPLDKVRQVLDYATQAIPAGHILMGMPNYGYDWTLPFAQGTAARSLSSVDAVTLAGQVGAGIQYDQAAQSPFFRYYDKDGRQHEVWFEDARSLRAKYGLVNEYGLAGVSFWNLNNPFHTNFIVLESMFSVEKVL